MDESSALDVAAMRALETADRARTLWSDDDRAWASRAAAEVVGTDAAPDAFLARRAALVLERIGPRHPALPRAVRVMQWRPWVGGAIAIAAFLLGLFVDQVDSAQRINILAPPVLGLIVWNLAVYIILAAGYVVRYGEASTPGPIRRAVARIAAGRSRPRRAGSMREVVLAFAADWTQRCAPLHAVRAGRIMHLSAAALAVGVIAGLYLRGIAFEYRASWQSTFLEPPVVHSIVAIAYAPGAYLTRAAVPDDAAVAAIRAPESENAARWLHLMAATLAALVIAPRLLLAAVDGLVERHRARRLAWSADDPYVQRLLRAYRGGPASVRVLPYSYMPTEAAAAGLDAVVARAFGGRSRVRVAPVVAYGSEPAATTAGDGAIAIALFSAAATPERETHGAFLARLRGQDAGGAGVLAMIDEGSLRERLRDTPQRIAERRAAWRQVSEEAGVPPVFVDLLEPDLGEVQAAIDAALEPRAA